MKSQAMKKPKITAYFRKKQPFSVRWGSLTYDGIPLLIGVTEDGAVCRLEFAAGKTQAGILARWKKAWPGTEFTADSKAVAPFVKKITSGGALNLMMVGTEFQCAVWENLLAIPSGKVITYAELARRARRPRAVRAAGTACGANPVPVLVPCHRVVGSNGGLGGFGGGLPTKKKLLKAEGFQEF